MKKTLAVLALAVMLLTGCVRQESTKAPYIGADQAKAIALEAADFAADDVQGLRTDLDSHDGSDHYEVSFTVNGRSYEYEIDAVTGEVIERDIPDQPAAAETAEPAETGAEQPAAAQSGGIDPEAAKAAALAHAGLAEGDVTFVQARLDYEDGRQVYDVEFYTADYREYDYEIDAATGEVVSYDYDAEGYTPRAAGDGAAISAEDAKALALAKVPGATAQDIREFETDRDDGRVEYEGTIRYDGMDYEFEIDAATGEIRSWEVEPIGH